MSKSKFKTREQLIKEEIRRLETSSHKWIDLIRQVDKAYKPIVLNPLQALVSFIADTRPPYAQTQKGWSLYVEAARGAGKSTIIADYIRRTVKALPRSTNILQGETYQQILTRTFPSTIHGLEMFGLFQNLHYFVGKPAPKSWGWTLPYKPPLKWDKVIHFWTGACYVMTSQDVIGDGRSLNADSRIADEAAMLNKEKLDSDSGPAVRGSNLSKFEKTGMLLHELFVSTTPVTEEGMWFCEMEEQANNEMLMLEEKFGKGNVPIGERSLYFLKADNRVNKKNLPADYNERAAKTTLRYVFEAEYMNIRPNRVKDGFYGMLDPSRHLYTDYNYEHYTTTTATDCRGDRDLVKGQPLILGVDWGAAINCLTVNQHLQSVNEYRTIKSMYVLGDDQKIQDDLFDDFHEYYQYHQKSNKTLLLFYDNQGNQQTGISKQTRAEKAAAQLRGLGWQVRLMTTGGRNENHELTYLTWTYILKGDHPRLPSYRMNKSNCKELLVSMKNAKILQDKAGIHKDKRSEKSGVVPRQYATDLSDANDKPIIVLFSHLLQAGGGSGSIGVRFS